MKFAEYFKSKRNPSKSRKSSEIRTYKIQYETKLTARTFTDNSTTIQSIVDKMVKEDPFKNFYTGKSDSDFGPRSKRVYKYDAITTVNVTLTQENDRCYSIYIEGIYLGKLPEFKSLEIQHYHQQYLLTAYAYISGGYYKEYSPEKESVIEAFEPYDIDLYIQFT